MAFNKPKDWRENNQLEGLFVIFIIESEFLSLLF